MMLRLANDDDLPFMQRMLDEASPGAPDPRYLDGWVRPGDCGLVALDESGEPVGAAWYRRLSADESSPPEVAIAVVEQWRGKGIGSALLDGLKKAARAQGLMQLSLVVEPGNLRTRFLAAKLGFREVEHTGGRIVLAARL